MRKLKLYIAISLDGKIAGPDDDVSWLDAIPNPEKSDYGYTDFTAGIDATIMGNNTYRWIKGQDIPWPYPDTDNYVLTRNKDLQDNAEARFIKEDHVESIKALKQSEGKDIWLIGGAGANQLCLKAGLIDELLIFVMPIVIGEGIGLFASSIEQQMLTLTASKTYASGVCELRYQVTDKTKPKG